jgi:hypothetical protein
MKVVAAGLAFAVIVLSVTSLSSGQERKPMAESRSSPVIQREEALKIARADAEKAYGELSPNRVLITLESDGWHVAYELRNPNQQGGGPQYVINAATGAVIAKKYSQ